MKFRGEGETAPPALPRHYSYTAVSNTANTLPLLPVCYISSSSKQITGAVFYWPDSTSSVKA